MQTTYLSGRTYSHYEKKKDGIYIYTDGAEAIQCVVCGDSVVRIWVDRTGKFEKRASFAVPEEHWEFTAYLIEETEEALFVCTERLTLEFGKSDLKWKYRERKSGKILLKGYEGQQLGFGDDGSLYSCYELAEEEHIYGLGEDNDAYTGNMDRRGSARDLVTGQTINKGCVTADIPIPFFMSTGRDGKGYGFFVDNTYRMEFDMGKRWEDRFFWRAEGGEAITYFIYGPGFKDIIRRYTDLTGKPDMLPLWTLGMIQCKCSYQDWDEIDDVVETLWEKGFPVDAVVFDYDWPEQMHNFKWHPRWKGMSPAKIREYRKRGIHFMVSNTGPMIKKDSSNFQDAMEQGVMALDAQGNTLTCGHYGGELMDFSAPNMKDWIKKQTVPLMDDGVEGWWLDLTEPEGEPVQTIYQGGSRAEIHNVYSYLSSKAYYEAHREHLPQSRPFILTRTGTAGIQRLGNAIWSGDVYSDYATFAAHCPEALNTGMTGIPYWTSDIGGFISSTYDSSNERNIQLYQNDRAAHGRLYERWFQFGCFCPITRVHHAGPSEPYRFGPLAEESCRRYIRLRYRLLPYIYTYMWKAHRDGLSIMRPLVLEYQNDIRGYDCKDEFLFGESLLVAPVLEENVTERKVYFPEGSWIDWDYGYEYAGGETYSVFAPQNRIPLFVKKGAILPMIAAMRSVSERAWSTIQLHIYPKGNSEFVMYQDDGNTMAYETEGKYTETAIRCEEIGTGCKIFISRSSRYYVPETYEVILHTEKIAASAVCEGKVLPVYSTKAAWKKAKEGIYTDNLEQLSYLRFAADQGLGQKVEVTYAAQPWEKAVPDRNLGLEEKQHPYLLPPATVPCKIQAENFDRGGEGIAFHVHHTENRGIGYRPEPVNVEVCTDEGGGYDVFDLAAQEWLEYTINITKNLTARNRYDLLLRIRCETAETRVHLCVDGDNKSGMIEIPETNGEWMTVTVPEKQLHDGEHIVQLYVENGRLSLNYIEIKIA